jgi:acyl-CoA hydrolase
MKRRAAGGGRRSHVVTEYGVAALRGASLNERALRLIAIAHPDHRDKLRFSARKAGLLH